MAAEKIACDVGRTIIRPDRFEGLDWMACCGHTPTERVWLRNEDDFILLCPCHYTGMVVAHADLEALPEGERECPAGDSS